MILNEKFFLRSFPLLRLLQREQFNFLETMKFKQESLSNDTPANDNYDLILKNMLITNPEAFQSYVGNRLWGLNNNAKRKISAGKLTQIIEKYKLSTKSRGNLKSAYGAGINRIQIFMFLIIQTLIISYISLMKTIN